MELLFETQKIWDAHEALRINDEDLIGMWHQMPVVPAGFANRYFFYSDHGFKFASNEMDGGCRIKRLYGKWKLVDNFVEVQIDAEDILNGGEIVGPWGSYGSKFVIDNGTIKEQALDPPLLFRIPIYLYIKNDDLDGKLRYTLPSLNFGAIRYWRMYNKPDEGDD